ncbi:MAG TPA: aldo/keto reductase [Gemmatimonadaceae bacterium]
MAGDLSRRGFLGGIGGVVGASLVGRRSTPLMLARPIPSTNEQLPVVGLGTWQTFDVPLSDSSGVERLSQTVRALYDAGGRVVDSSPMYGRSEEAFGAIAQRLKLTNELFMATKVWTNGERAGIEQMRASAAFFHRKTIDLMQIHNLVDWKTHLPTLRRDKDAGRIRYIGISHYTASAYPELERVIRSEQIDFVQLAYAPGYRAAEKSLLPLAAERGVAVIVNRPFEGGGGLRAVLSKPFPQEVHSYANSWAQAFLKFIIANTAVTCVIPGTGSPQHMTDNAAAGSSPLPSERERRRLLELIGA